MGLAKTAMVFFFIINVVCVLSMAMGNVVYKVGGAAGWTNIGNVDFKSWAASKNFHVGDTILFEYNKEFHNVVRVTHKNFNACNSTAPYETFATGADSFTIKKPGHFYFICSVPGHCEGGQKVDIRVSAASNSAPASAPSPTDSEAVPPSHGHGHPSSSPVLPKFQSPTVSPSPVEAPVPSAHAPHRNAGVSLYSSWKLWVPVAVLSFGLSAIAF
ncbi:unnamed protein product [Fraxinus pennsylvanica]|uniref:Phytocyanin domain-containing protein n=1 Tax=Fraxinus pennsylvanica TaxID=56036 RepID=A0AAD2DPD7_9LAMI|nr:unnamed protein product [Fraxinus pennsylvanica]